MFLSVLTFPFLNSQNRLRLYKKIYNSLKYGGSLIFVDKIRSSNSNFEDIFNQIYYDFKIENKLNHSQVLNKSKSIRSSMQILSYQKLTTSSKNLDLKSVKYFLGGIIL